MADFEKLIPFILHFEAGLNKSQMKLPLPEMFETAKRKGYSNDPADAGGATMCGVTIATYTAFRKSKGFQSSSVADLKNISLPEWKEILKNMFWDRWKADKIDNHALANILVDFVWASGVHGIKVPQRVLGVKADGIVGPATLEAVNAANPADFFARLQKSRIDFVNGIVRRKPSQSRFLRGWVRRISCITLNGFRYD